MADFLKHLSLSLSLSFLRDAYLCSVTHTTALSPPVR